MIKPHVAVNQNLVPVHTLLVLSYIIRLLQAKISTYQGSIKPNETALAGLTDTLE